MEDTYISIQSVGVTNDTNMTSLLDREQMNYSPTSLSDDEKSMLEGHNSSEDEHIDKNAEKHFNKYYYYDKSQSNKLDILLTFIKGQKHLFNHCSSVSKHKMNCLMIPTIIISSFNTIFTPFFKDTNWINNVSSGLNSIILLFLSMMGYFKYETSSESFFQISKQYDRLETSVKLMHSSIYFNNNMDFDLSIQEPKTHIQDSRSGSSMSKKMLDKHYNDKIVAIENRINEIKESQQFSIPSETRNIFPIIYHVNIFTLIRKMDNYRNQLLFKFRSVNHEIKQIIMKPSHHSQDDCENNDTSEQTRLNALYKLKSQIKDELYNTLNVYGDIEDIFSREINHANSLSLWGCLCQTHKKMDFSHLHPVISKHFTFVFEED
jgi:hypothetical protein